ncbi:MAG: Smr/MutS family protein [Chloroflexota bacterium]|nr:Smr/MutS family protein [Chloroflexota bacterium]
MPSSKLDLHGKTWAEALTEFRDFYNAAARSHPRGGVQLEVVHGYGSTGQGGRLQTSLRNYLERQSNLGLLSYRTGETVDGNPGHTLITTLKPLPAAGDDLADSIWEFCARPQSHSKVMNRFRRHGDPQVQQALRSLQGQKRLKPVTVGREKGYEAV